MQRAIRLYSLAFVSAALAGFVPMAAEAQTVPNVDLAIVSNMANVKHGHVGQLVTFTIIATNNGPDTAPSLDVYDNAALQGLQVGEEICDLGISPDPPGCAFRKVSPSQTLRITAGAYDLRKIAAADQRAELRQ